MDKPCNLDALDRQIINALQGGFPVSNEPYKEVAAWFGIKRTELINRLEAMTKSGAISRFGPLFNPERLGGAVTLAALSIPQERFDEVADLVNAHREIAHNYARSHALNMWFVIATEKPGQIDDVIQKIEQETGLEVYNFPKEKEFFIGLRLEA
jgi:DNA-binding Lrp family transcriptional regulator